MNYAIVFQFSLTNHVCLFHSKNKSNNSNGNNSSTSSSNKGAGDGLRQGEKLSKKPGASARGENGKPTPIKLSPEDAQFKWEIDNCGGYRLIFPLPDAEKYDKFLDQNLCSIYQETAASQARANMTRNQLDEYNVCITQNTTALLTVRKPVAWLCALLAKLLSLAKEAKR